MSYMLILSIKKCNYKIFADQTSLSLTKFIMSNTINISPYIKFTMKIYFIANLSVLTEYLVS